MQSTLLFLGQVNRRVKILLISGELNDVGAIKVWGRVCQQNILNVNIDWHLTTHTSRRTNCADFPTEMTFSHCLLLLYQLTYNEITSSFVYCSKPPRSTILIRTKPSSFQDINIAVQGSAIAHNYLSVFKWYKFPNHETATLTAFRKVL